MTNSTQRIVLLAGASLAAIGIANPAYAAPTTSTTTPFPPTSYPIVAPSINDTLIIATSATPLRPMA